MTWYEGAIRVDDGHDTARREIAVEIAVEAGALQHCEEHDQIYRGEPSRLQAARALAGRMYGHLSDLFASPSQVVSTVDRVMANPLAACPQCLALPRMTEGMPSGNGGGLGGA